MTHHCAQACDILRATSDGRDLSKLDLCLVEGAVNDNLTELGERSFDELHRSVMEGRYFKGFLSGIEHLTQDHEGYVYWRGIHVEHYSFEDRAQEHAAAERLAADCRTLEAKGFPINARTAISREVIDAPKDTPWLDALCHFYSFFAKDDRIKVVLYKKGGKDGVVALEKLKDGTLSVERFTGFLDAYDAYHALKRQGFESQAPYLNYEQVAGLLERSGITPDEITISIS